MSEQCGGDSSPKRMVERDCYVDGCGYTATSEIFGSLEAAKHLANERAERHFDREHRGKARIKAVFEKRVKPHPKQDLSKIVDRQHDRMGDEVPGGYELAYVVGEELEAPDPVDGADRSKGGDSQ